MIAIAALAVTLVVTGLLTIGRYARSEHWRATVTPLASIIGSGFLICGPLLAKEFGGAAAIAMAVLLVIAYAVGAVVRFNITHLENYHQEAPYGDMVLLVARLTQVVLAVAYTISVAYYLKLLAEFSLKLVDLPDHWHAVVSNTLVTCIILAFMMLAWSGGLIRVERLAQYSVSLKIGVIAGLLTGLGVWWFLHVSATPALPPVRVSFHSIPMLLGLLITVQGFETSRYLGFAYSQEVRIRTMRDAQIISSVIYMLFLLLLTPFLTQASHAEGVAGILDIMTFVSAPLAIFVFIGAASSQLSAAVADSIGSGGLMREVTGNRIGVREAFGVASALGIAVVWLTDPFQVVAVASRAFALFYAFQCLLALLVAWRTGEGSRLQHAGFAIIGGICLIAAAVGAPAE